MSVLTKEQEKARAWLRERMGEGWHVEVDQEHSLAWAARCWHGRGSNGGVEVTWHAETPQAAAEAAWAAWQEATDKALDAAIHEARAERAHADRLADVIGKAADQLHRHPTWDSHMSGTWTMLVDALAAHRARREKDGE